MSSLSYCLDFTFYIYFHRLCFLFLPQSSLNLKPILLFLLYTLYPSDIASIITLLPTIAWLIHPDLTLLQSFSPTYPAKTLNKQGLLPPPTKYSQNQTHIFSHKLAPFLASPACLSSSFSQAQNFGSLFFTSFSSSSVMSYKS